MNRECRGCGETFRQYNSVQALCFNCTRAKFLATPQKKRKAIRKVGKVTEAWFEYRDDWIERHGGVDGRWVCALRIGPVCPIDLTFDTLTLDHRIPRSGAPGLRYNDGNVQTACLACNTAKGSRRL